MENKNELVVKENKEINDLIDNKVKNTTDVKTAIDLLSTRTALKQDGTIGKLVEEKQQELKNDAEAKRIKAETDRIKEEVDKVKQEAEKEIAEYNRQIDAYKKEAEKLAAEVGKLQGQDDKAKQFFESNKSVLKCIGVREKLSLKAMQWLMIPAGIVYTIFQIILLPFSLLGFAMEAIMNIVDAVCGKISKAGLKIVLSIVVVLVVIGLAFGAYYLFANVINGNVL